MTCGIYMIQNLANGKIYIGQAVDIEYRWKVHKTKLRGNRHDNTHLQRSWNTHGGDNFEFTIICECDENQLNTMEEYYIFELMSYDPDFGYNKSYGGWSGRPTEESKKKLSESRKGKTHSEETKKKMSESRKGENNGMYGKHHTEETRKKQSENRANMKKENNPFYGKHHTEEARKKMSEAHKGKTLSEETRKKLRKSSRRGAKNPKSIPVVQLTLDGELVNIYGSAGEAERNGFEHTTITACIKGRRKTHGGYKWMYLHEYIAKMNPNIKTINLFGKTYEVNQEEVKMR